MNKCTCSMKNIANVKYCYVNSVLHRWKLNTQAEEIYLTVNIIFFTESP